MRQGKPAKWWIKFTVTEWLFIGPPNGEREKREYILMDIPLRTLKMSVFDGVDVLNWYVPTNGDATHPTHLSLKVYRKT